MHYYFLRTTFLSLSLPKKKITHFLGDFVLFSFILTPPISQIGFQSQSPSLFTTGNIKEHIKHQKKSVTQRNHVHRHEHISGHVVPVTTTFFVLVLIVTDVTAAAGVAASPHNPRELRLASDWAHCRPARLLLVPRPRDVLQETGRQVQEHRVPYERPPLVPVLPQRQPERRGRARLQVLLAPLRHGLGGEEERPRGGLHAQRQVHWGHQGRSLPRHLRATALQGKLVSAFNLLGYCWDLRLLVLSKVLLLEPTVASASGGHFGFERSQNAKNMED